MSPASALSSRLVDIGSTVAAVGDPEATRAVYTTVVLLLLLGLAMVVLAVWVFRRTRPEPELLAPLETMESRNWRRLDPATQRRLLDDARPPGAAPLQRQAPVPTVDDEFAVVAPVASFADLADDDAFDLDVTSGDPLPDDIGLPDDIEFPEDIGEAPAGDMADAGSLDIEDPVADASGPEGARDGRDDVDFDFDDLDDEARARSSQVDHQVLDGPRLRGVD